LRALAFAVLVLTPAAVFAQGPPIAFVGGEAGFSADRLRYAEPAFPPFVINEMPRGFTGGVLAGYGPHSHGFGLEGDFGTSNVTFNENDTGGNGYTAISTRWVAHVRSVIGFGSGDFMPFVSLGAAIARVKVDDVDPGFGKAEMTQNGWTLGAGAQCAMSPHLTVRGEYLYDNYGTRNFTIAAPQGQFFPSYVAQVKLRANIIRAAVLLRF
jgi:outer membrane immunogenic protein